MALDKNIQITLDNKFSYISDDNDVVLCTKLSAITIPISKENIRYKITKPFVLDFFVLTKKDFCLKYADTVDKETTMKVDKIYSLIKPYLEL